MALYNTQSDQSAQQIFDKAHEIFGEDGLGLEVVEDVSHRLSFEGDDGQILITVSDEIEPTSVSVETLNWE